MSNEAASHAAERVGQRVAGVRVSGGDRGADVVTGAGVLGHASRAVLRSRELRGGVRRRRIVHVGHPDGHRDGGRGVVAVRGRDGDGVAGRRLEVQGPPVSSAGPWLGRWRTKPYQCRPACRRACRRCPRQWPRPGHRCSSPAAVFSATSPCAPVAASRELRGVVGGRRGACRLRRYHRLLRPSR